MKNQCCAEFVGINLLNGTCNPATRAWASGEVPVFGGTLSIEDTIGVHTVAGLEGRRTMHANRPMLQPSGQRTLIAVMRHMLRRAKEVRRSAMRRCTGLLKEHAGYQQHINTAAGISPMCGSLQGSQLFLSFRLLSTSACTCYYAFLCTCTCSCHFPCVQATHHLPHLEMAWTWIPKVVTMHQSTTATILLA